MYLIIHSSKCHVQEGGGYDKKALNEQVFGNTSCEDGQFGPLPCEVDSVEALDDQKQRQYLLHFRKYCIHITQDRDKGHAINL